MIIRPYNHMGQCPSFRMFSTQVPMGRLSRLRLLAGFPLGDQERWRTGMLEHAHEQLLAGLHVEHREPRGAPWRGAADR